MKIVKNKKSKKPLIIAIVSILLVLSLAGGVFAYYHDSLFPKSDTPSNETTTSPEKGGQQNNANENSNSNNATSDDNNKTPENNDTSSGNTTNGSLSINTVTSNAHIRISTQISELWSSGTCNLSMTNGSETITREVPIQALSSYSTCQGFDIDLSNGSWNIKITASHNTDSITATKEVVVK